MSYPPLTADHELLSSTDLFDTEFYELTYPDVRQIGIDPLLHYLWIGARLGRDPSAWFSTRGYLDTHGDVAAAGMNPLVHYAAAGRLEGRYVPHPGDTKPWVAEPAQYVPRTSYKAPNQRLARLIAFYLPQFHAIPENNEWWGEGFTEWSNVRPALPKFEGHYQPHVPHEDIGHYQLTERDSQQRQIELAKAYGVDGFCFYYYWFAGKRLLETPIENYLADPSLDHPFCLCWANENWSRRWDGLDSEVLMAQEHSAEDDLGCIADLGRYMQDERYIRVGGKPVLLIYRPSLLPDIKATAARWREWCRQNGIGEIFLAYPQSFEKADPREYGFDAAIEFPPNNSGPPDLTSRVTPLSSDYAGKVYDWNIFLERSQAYADPGYRLIRSVCPGWDNTARRKAGGTAFVNNTPEKYEQWLRNAVDDTVSSTCDYDERLIFVNAWNEWAEGAHLEPDQANGYAYLEATRRAISGAPSSGGTLSASPGSDAREPAAERRVVLVSHDAYRHGAQYLALNIARTLSQELGYHVDMIVLGDGPMKVEFARWATVHDLAGKDIAGCEVRKLADRLYKAGARSVLANTLVSAPILPVLHGAGLRIVSMIHEMPAVVKQMGLQSHVELTSMYASKIVFASQAVSDGFGQFASLKSEQGRIRPQGLYKVNRVRRIPGGIQAARHGLRRRLGLPDHAPIVLGVGYADFRKGPDLFVEAGLTLLERHPHARFIWLGAEAEADWMERVRAPALAAGKADHFFFPGMVEATDEFYAAADAFALTSREDPFPSVVLEAMDCGLPVVAFAGTGGMEDILRETGNVVVPAFDTGAYAQALHDAISDGKFRATCFERGTDTIDRKFSFRKYCHDLLSFVGEPLPRVSVIVPNYNYAAYIGERLRSITSQTYPVYELVVLDDKSPDNSVELIRAFLDQTDVPHSLLVNEENSGSVFRQWQKGVALAEGDLVWIAEADDLAHPNFLENVVAGFVPGVVLSYCQSRQIDECGAVLSDDYLDYVSDLGADIWRHSYRVSGREEISRALFLKNTIPNASAVVFDREALARMLADSADEVIGYRNAGDWVAYIRLLEQGDIAFTPLALNDHRRHSGSVTIGNSNKRHHEEIVKVQTDTIARFALGDEAEQQARAYADRIARQFGLIDEFV